MIEGIGSASIQCSVQSGASGLARAGAGGVGHDGGHSRQREGFAGHALSGDAPRVGARSQVRAQATRVYREQVARGQRVDIAALVRQARLQISDDAAQAARMARIHTASAAVSGQVEGYLQGQAQTADPRRAAAAYGAEQARGRTPADLVLHGTGISLTV